MPRYDYHCSACAKTFMDVWVSTFREVQDSARNCTICAQPMIKLPSAPAFAIKGYNAKNGYSK